MPGFAENGAATSDTLHGWKDISSYLNRSVRAAQRWERDLGLPVHRIKGTEGQTVYAFRAEIDEWRKSRDLSRTAAEDEHDALDDESVVTAPEDAGAIVPRTGSITVSGRLRRWTTTAVLAALLLAVGVGVGGFLAAGQAGAMVAVQAVGTSVVAYDSSGRTLWSTDFGRQISLSAGSASSADTGGLFADLDEDGQAEAIVPLRFSAAGTPSSESDFLVAFDSHGTILWKFQPNHRLTCGSDEFAGPWRIYAIKATTGPGRQRFWAAFNHSTWWPGFVMDVTAEGQPHVRMLNTGWIWDLAEWRTSSGTFLAVSGFNNEWVRPTVSLIDVEEAITMSPYGEERFSCDDGPVARPDHVYLLPLLETGLPADTFAITVRAMESSLKVKLRNGSGDAVVTIGSDLGVQDFSVTDSYWAVHRQLETDGFLKHPAETCPLRNQPQPVDEWTPTTGWRSFTMVPAVRQSLPK